MIIFERTWPLSPGPYAMFNCTLLAPRVQVVDQDPQRPVSYGLRHMSMREECLSVVNVRYPRWIIHGSEKLIFANKMVWITLSAPQYVSCTVRISLLCCVTISYLYGTSLSYTVHYHQSPLVHG